MLDFEYNKLIEELNKLKPKRVLVQLAEGIKQYATEIYQIIDNLGIECIFSGETCWGGCSIALQEAQALGADLIVHFGHAEFIKTDFPVLYIEVKDILDLSKLLKSSLKVLRNYKRIGFSYSIQHKHDIQNIKNFYEKNNKKVFLSKRIGYVAYEGHIVGCQYEGLKAIQNSVDAFVIIGNQFHAMGAVLAVTKPVILIDVYNNKVKSMKGLRERIIKQRAFCIEKFKEAKNVGVIIEIKPGQKFGSPKYILNKLKESGKNPVLITMSEITPEKVMNFYYIDAFVELACPRIALDDFHKYNKPILTMKEAMVGLGEKKWKDLLKSGFV